MLKGSSLNISKDIEFPDHYTYSISDIKKILKQANDLEL